MRREFENGGVLVWRLQGSRYTTKGASVDLGVITRSEAEKFAWLWAARLVADEDKFGRDDKEVGRNNLVSGGDESCRQKIASRFLP